ncbi:hypothetical protein [Aeoliella sp.]|uniref:hypothetical protein n=1 Tax=Aeoliella sp. TaxID=2795800 RepID=UPI003CCBC491
MSNFLYFKSGDTRKVVTKDDVAELGLEYALGASIENREVTAGPGGQKGVVFCDSLRSDRPAGYFPDKQTWREMPARDGRPPLYIGYWNDAKPTPESLAREGRLKSVPVIMADDQPWRIPIVRQFNEETGEYESKLPAYLDYDEHGNAVRGRTLDCYQSLWDLTAPVVEPDFGTGDPNEDELKLFTAAVALLQANYAVALPELAILGVLAADDSIVAAIQIHCRYDQLLRLTQQDSGE